MNASNSGLLSGLRVIESSVLLPGFTTSFLADLGAEVIKVEPPAGDYIRQMTWPIVEGVSLLHLHTNRGKKSLTLDLKTPEGIEHYLELVKTADVVFEGMRPGSLAKLGLGFDELSRVNPQVVFASLSGYGASGPYRDLPSHGIAFDAWSGIVEPVIDDDGFARIPRNMPNIGINVGPMMTAMAVLAGVLKARETGVGSEIEVAQCEASAYLDWYRIETERAYLRPEDEVTGNASDNFERRPAGLAGMWEGVRYQAYEASDGFILLMASEKKFWRNLCEGIDRMDLFEKWPGERFADHARNNLELQSELKAIFKERTVREWLEFADRYDTAIAPFNTSESLAEDPQFKARMGFLPREAVGCEQLALPISVNGERLRAPTKAPTVGEHNEDISQNMKWPADSGGASSTPKGSQ